MRTVFIDRLVSGSDSAKREARLLARGFLR